jgi:hypothetical protein
MLSELASVHFAQGDTTKAIDVMTRAVALAKAE